MERFAGRTALVTGASSGIGRATAVRLVEEGARVFGASRNAEALEETRSLVSDPDRFTAYSFDARDDQSTIEMVQAAADHLGHIDVLVNNAGTTTVAPVADQDMDLVRDMAQVNFFAPVLICREALPHLTDGSGAIINITSISATQAHPGMTAYAASKGALLSYSLTLAVELAARQIRVVAVSPSQIRSSIESQTWESLQAAELDAWYVRLQNVWGSPAVDPSEAASVIAFAASSDAKFVNGTEIRVDGAARSAS